MCRSPMPGLEEEMPAIAQATALRAKQLSERYPAVSSSSAVDYKISPRSSPSATPLAHVHCVRGWWRDTLCNTAKELNANAPSFSSHITSLRNAQQCMHRLARKCTQARLYPNPASANSKPLLKSHLDTLVADMDFAVRLHDLYSVALSMYIFPVQAVIDNLNISSKECHCSHCARQSQWCTTDTHAEIQLEATGLMCKLIHTSCAFKTLNKDLLERWEKYSKNGLCRMISALPEQEDLRKSAIVKKYFPRQIREIEKAENRTMRKPTFIDKLVSKNTGNSAEEEDKYDSACETVSKLDI